MLTRFIEAVFQDSVESRRKLQRKDFTHVLNRQS
jgi:hypothetical protein